MKRKGMSCICRKMAEGELCHLSNSNYSHKWKCNGDGDGQKEVSNIKHRSGEYGKIKI